MNLVRHIQKVVTKTVDENDENIQAGSVKFVKSDSLNIATIGKKVKEFEVVVIQSGADSDLLNKFDYAIKEHVLGNTCIAVYIVSDSIVKDLSTDFQENPDVVIEKIFVKDDKPKIVNGVKRDIIPITIVGNKDLFKGKEISNFHSKNVRDALPEILIGLVEVGGGLLSIFSDRSGAFDIDPNSILKRKGVFVCYVSRKDDLKQLEKIITKSG